MKLPSRTAGVGLGSAVVLLSLLTACNGNGGKSSAKPIPRVGLMHVGTDHIPPSRDTLEARLKQLGWINGQNIKLI